MSEAKQTARILVAGVGYRNLRDLSFGPVMADRLQRLDWPAGVEVEDLSYGPVAVMHGLDERPAYDRVILIAGVKRERPTGVYCYRWNHELPDEDEIQARVGEAVTGVISLDNLLIVATYFRKLPRDVLVIEVEALDEDWGEGFTQAVEEAAPRVVEEIRAAIKLEQRVAQDAAD